jgi:hypothetical protein
MRSVKMMRRSKLLLCGLLGLLGACKAGDGDKAAPKDAPAQTSAPGFDVEAMRADLAEVPAQVGSLTWFGPGREIMVGWMQSVGFVSDDCKAVYASLDRSYAIDYADGKEIRAFVGNIDKAKVVACAKLAADKGLFAIAEIPEGLRFDGGEGGSFEAVWKTVGGGTQVIAAEPKQLAAYLQDSGPKLVEDAKIQPMLELFDGDTGIWSFYLPSAEPNPFGVDYEGIVMTNGGSALRMEGRVLFADAAKRDAGLKVFEDLYAKAYAKAGTKLRGLLEKSDAGSPMVRFNLQFSDAELLNELMVEHFGPPPGAEKAQAPAAPGPEGATGPTGAAGATGATAAPSAPAATGAPTPGNSNDPGE